jgi:peptidoglycan/xylan/chitin deacetylase (PgdA/CDA1 family)
VGAALLIAVAVVAVLQALVQGTGVSVAYARPSMTSLEGLRASVSISPAPAARFWQSYDAPDTRPAVVPVGRSPVAVPILMYHYIRVPPDPQADRLGYGLSVSPNDFRDQMNWLADHGYHTITIGDLRRYLQGEQPLPDRPVALTFDDGYLDLYTEAFPVLVQHHFTATAYIVSGFVGAPGRNVSQGQIVEMDRYGVEIASHTFSHADLTSLRGDRLGMELGASKAALESLVGHPVVDFCYPAGRFDAAVVDAVRAAGYESATTTVDGVMHSFDDRFTWSRVRVSGGESLDDFARGLSRYEAGARPTTPPPPIQVPRVFPLLLTGVLNELQ